VFQFRNKPGILPGKMPPQFFREGKFQFFALLRGHIRKGGKIYVQIRPPLRKTAVYVFTPFGKIRGEILIKYLKFFRYIVVCFLFEGCQFLLHPAQIGPKNRRGIGKRIGDRRPVLGGFLFETGKVLTNPVFRVLHVAAEFPVQTGAVFRQTVQTPKLFGLGKAVFYKPLPRYFQGCLFRIFGCLEELPLQFGECCFGLLFESGKPLSYDRNFGGNTIPEIPGRGFQFGKEGAGFGFRTGRGAADLVMNIPKPAFQGGGFGGKGRRAPGVFLKQALLPPGGGFGNGLVLSFRGFGQNTLLYCGTGGERLILPG
jgi:hypothetical protein